MEKKTTLPHILRPYLTIVNSDLYYFRFFEDKTTKIRIRIHKWDEENSQMKNTG
jgi:hypothetical protein